MTDSTTQLTKEQQAAAINLAMGLELESYNPYMMRELMAEFNLVNPGNLNPLLSFWATTNDMTRKAYLAFMFYYFATNPGAVA